MESGGKPALPIMTGDAGCPVAMDDEGSACGRPLHLAPEGVDDRPVCLMHSKDPGKQTGGPHFDDFRREFEAILTDAGEGEANFQRFVFPELDLSVKEIQAVCRFRKAIFTENAYFTGATFTQDAYFEDATFTRLADFRFATFTKRADFGGATFTQLAGFGGATFTKYASFFRATFTKLAYFEDATFTQLADFTFATFTLAAGFHGATFTWAARFYGATFTHWANFNKATFTQDAHFDNATFTKRALFSQATFTQDAHFDEATFTQAATFTETKFLGTAGWKSSRFLESAEFRRTEFSPKVVGKPSAVFALAHFNQPGEIVFDDVDLSRALFHNCDVTGVWFTSSVRWGRGVDNREAQIFEETIPLEQRDAEGLKRNGRRDYRAIAQTYQQLKKNYDTRLDYWTANELHFGEMEMKRLASPTEGRLLGLRRWAHPRLSLVALYRKASDYGNNYRKPMIRLLGLLLLFALLFPLPWAGLQRSGTSNRETYNSVWRAGSSARQRLWWEAGLFGKSFLTAVDTATFQKGAEYAPAYPGGRALAIAETLLTSTLFALFLLAIRRQFRR